MTNPAPMAFIDLGAQRRRLGDRVDNAVRAVLDHGAYILGPEVRTLEGELSRKTGARSVVTCANGTDALVLALRALGIGHGDVVVVPSFTFAASAEAVALVGATPLFSDVDPSTFTLDAPSLETALAEPPHGHLRAVIAVDLFGQPADYEALAPLCRERGLSLVVDAAQSFGATLNGRSVTTYGDLATTSFFPAKPLGCYGDGGAVFCQNENHAAVLRSLRVHGQGRNKYENDRIGTNSRLDTIQAAVLLAKLEILDDELDARQRVADCYEEGLRDIIKTPTVRRHATSAWAQYTVQVDGRDEVARQLQGQGIPTAVYYPKPLHQQPAYRAFPAPKRGLPISEALSARVLSIPMHPYLTQADQDRVVAALRAAV